MEKQKALLNKKLPQQDKDVKSFSDKSKDDLIIEIEKSHEKIEISKEYKDFAQKSNLEKEQIVRDKHFEREIIKLEKNNYPKEKIAEFKKEYGQGAKTEQNNIIKKIESINREIRQKQQEPNKETIYQQESGKKQESNKDKETIYRQEFNKEEINRQYRFNVSPTMHQANPTTTEYAININGHAERFETQKDSSPELTEEAIEARGNYQNTVKEIHEEIKQDYEYEEQLGEWGEIRSDDKEIPLTTIIAGASIAVNTRAEDCIPVHSTMEEISSLDDEEFEALVGRGVPSWID